MKKITIALLSIVALASCETVKENEYKVSAAVVGNDIEGKQIILKKIGDNNQPEDVDTTTIVNGKFSFEGIAEVPELHYIFIQDVNSPVGVVLEEGNIDITAYKDSIGFSIIGGTKSNDEFYQFVTGQRKISEKIQEIREQYRDANSQGDSITASTLLEVYEETATEARGYGAVFLDENKSSYISALLLQSMLAEKSKTVEEVKTIFDDFPEKVKNSKIGKNLGKTIDEIITAQKNVSIGNIAPDFSAPTPTGEVLSLSDIKGKVTIIDFWAAWCKPCRVENPRVLAMYNKYHDQGLNIVGVSLDRRPEDWTKAIEEDKLPWNHVSNLLFWQDPIAKLYNVRAIPATFILDAEGKIVARDLRGPELEAKVSELLNSSL